MFTRGKFAGKSGRSGVASARRGRRGLRPEVATLEERVVMSIGLTNFLPPSGVSINSAPAYGPDGKIYALYQTPSAVGLLSFQPSTGTYQQIPVAGVLPAPGSITTGPDGAIWFTEITSGGVGQLDRYQPGTGALTTNALAQNPSPYAVLSAAGSLWVFDAVDGGLAIVTTAGVVQNVNPPVPAGDHIAGYAGQVVASDGAVWFLAQVDNSGNGLVANTLYRATLAGGTASFTNEHDYSTSTSTTISAGLNGGIVVWTGVGNTDAFDLYTSAGARTTVATATQQVDSLGLGADGNLWGAVVNGASTTLAQYAYPSMTQIASYLPSFPNPGPTVIQAPVVGPNGTLWMSVNNTGTSSTQSLFLETTGVANTPTAWVQSLYNVELGRVASYADSQTWVGNIGTLTTAQIVSFIDGAAEADAFRVKGWYMTYLGREATPLDVANWVTVMQAGETDEQVQAAILGSIEYALRTPAISGLGGSPNPTTFVTALFLQLLGHAPSQTQINDIVPLVDSIGRQAVASILLNTNEYRGDVVAGYYTTLLHRTGTAAEIASWVNTGDTIAEIRQGFENSTEYILKVQS